MKLKKNTTAENLGFQISERIDRFLPEMSLKDKKNLIADITERVSVIGAFTAYDIRKRHPKRISCASDRYYAALATRISREIAMLPIQAEVAEATAKDIGLVMATYLDDVVSGIGVWAAFRNMYRATYGTWLPFYDCTSDYYPDEVNPQDVRFLTWQIINRWGHNNDTVFSPLSDTVNIIGDIVYAILEDAFETAPETVRLRELIDRYIAGGDYFELRELAEWLRFENLLLAAPNMNMWIGSQINDVLSGNYNIGEWTPDLLLYTFMVRMAWDATGPMGCSPAFYLAWMARDRKFDDVAAKLENFRIIKDTTFEITDFDSDTITLSDGTDARFVLDRTSIKNSSDIDRMKTMTGTIVRFGDTWQQNGAVAMSPESEIDKEKPIVQEYCSDAILNLCRNISEQHKGRRIFYLKSYRELEKILGIPHKNENEKVDNLVLLLSFTEGPFVIQNMAGCFTDTANKFYNKAFSEDNSLEVMSCYNIPDDIAAIMQNEHLLGDASMYMQQGHELGLRTVQQNLRFLIGFYRTDNPEI